MKLDEAMLDGLTVDCKTPQDVAALYAQMLQSAIERAGSGETFGEDPVETVRLEPLANMAVAVA